MKKCASCTKDLPDAALHCVFCGAKQAAAPAVQPGLAKTAFGYSANEVMQQLGNPPGGQPGYGAPAQAPAPAPYEPPRAQSPSQAPYAPSGLASPSAANAKTMMAAPGTGPMFDQNQGYAATVPQQGGAYQQPPQQGYQPPQQGYQPPQQGFGGAPQGGYGGAPQGGGYQPPQQQPYAGGGMGIHSQPQNTPSPLPVAQQPYLAANTAARAGAPIEPWKDALKLMMLVWGAVALVSFATPVTADPMTFNWDAIINGPGKFKIPPLIWAAVGLLSLACAAIPMNTLPRGAIALVLGLAGVFVPVLIMGMPPWQALLPIVGMLTLIPGLLVRHEYTESLTARVLVTIGVVATLLPMLIPNNGEIPLVGIFKGLIDAPGEAKVDYIMQIAMIVVVVMSLLAWMPGPATGGAKLIAWAIILFPVADFLVGFLLAGNVGDVISKRPGVLVHWAPMTVYMVLVGYGGATVVGKQLE